MRSSIEAYRLTWLHVNILPLHPEHIQAENEDADKQANRAAPPHNRVAEQVILELQVAPTAHPKTEMKEGPVEWFGSQNVFLVRVRDERIVGGHHCHIEVPKVA